MWRASQHGLLSLGQLSLVLRHRSPGITRASLKLGDADAEAWGMALSIHRPVGWSLRRRRRAQARGPLRVAMFTPSYPRDATDLAGRFVFNTVEHLRGRQVDVEVVAPGSYRDFGLTGSRNGGVVAALKRRPWLPLFLS